MLQNSFVDFQLIAILLFQSFMESFFAAIIDRKHVVLTS